MKKLIFLNEIKKEEDLTENFKPIENNRNSFFNTNKYMICDSVFNEDTLTKRNSFPLGINNDNIPLVKEESEETSLLVDNNDNLHYFGLETFDRGKEIINNNFSLNQDFFTLKKNRNNFDSVFENKNYYLKNETTEYKLNDNYLSLNTSLNLLDSSTEIVTFNKYSSMRCDSLLIRFKSVLGKWFIKTLNSRLKSILKRKIKFFSFNYKKFTIIVSYLKNKKWLDEKIKDLLILGDEPNQTKNKKALKSLYKKNIEELNTIKNLLEQNYRNIIELFYLSEDFIIFKNDRKIKELNNNFVKIMEVSLLEHNGFIKFLELRKGNTRKK
jgi:hypothetical protein